MLLSVISLLAASGAVNALDRRASAQSWASTADGSHKLSSYDAPVLGAGNPGISDWKFSIKESSKKQLIKGFGAAVTDGTVVAFNKLPANTRTQLLKDLTTSSGINFNLMRHTIASSDLSDDPAYSFADNGNQADPSLQSFNLGDRGIAMASMLAEMKNNQGNMTILGSPWSPPGWMKLNRKIIGTTNQNNLDHQYEDAYAQYFVKYINEFEKRGAHIDAITLQNEPLNSKALMPTMYIFADESGRLVRDNVGPALKNAGLNTQIWAFDHNTQDYDYPQTVLKTAGQYTNTAAWHCYSGNDPNNWAPLTRFHNEFPTADQYMTECWTAKGITDWQHTSNFNMLPLQNWANGIIAWALGSYTNGGPALSGSDNCHQCTGLVTVNPDSKTYTKEVDYYMMGQYSKFMPKGARVVDGTGSYIFDDGSGMLSVATVNPDNTRTVVIQNRYDHDMFVQVSTEREGSSWNARVPGSSTTTWVLPAKG